MMNCYIKVMQMKSPELRFSVPGPDGNRKIKIKIRHRANLKLTIVTNTELVK